MNAPWLTVAMPVHGGQAWLPATLSSLARQADPGIEVLLVDSSPDDRSADVARGFADRLNLTIMRRPDLKGWPEKTSLAIASGTADHAVMLHQDDLWLPGRAATLRRWMARAPEAALHLAPTRIVDGAGRPVGRWQCPLRPGPVAEAVLARRLSVQNFISVPAPLFRRDAFLTAGGLDPRLWYTADWDLWLKLAQAGPVHYHRDFTTGFRIHGQSLTMTGSRALDDLAAQMRIVADRHAPWRDRHGSRMAPTLSDISIRINVALAGAASGNGPRPLLAALVALVALGPVGMCRYFHSSRIIERVLPRLRGKLAGAL